MMTSILMKKVLAVAALAGFSTGAFAQGAAPTPWELRSPKVHLGVFYGAGGNQSGQMSC